VGRAEGEALGVGRLADQKGLCAIGRQAVVASYFAHFGEENCLRGWNGSGTIFFSGCNLRCVFCQNHDISWEVQGERVTPARLAEAVAGGLRLPIVYNTSAYDSLDSLRLMEGVVDVYMPDFKLWSQPAARRYLRRPEYAEVAREAVKEMARQVGPLVFDPDGLARRGLLLRHLVMPGMLAETKAILCFVAQELGPDTYVDLMAQYYPAGLVGRNGRDGYQEIDRHLYQEEYLQAVDVGHELGCGWMSAASPARRGCARPAPCPDAAGRCAATNRPDRLRGAACRAHSA
jgi:putative pyruvate formate lyase activating enzyme